MTFERLDRRVVDAMQEASLVTILVILSSVSTARTSQMMMQQRQWIQHHLSLNDQTMDLLMPALVVLLYYGPALKNCILEAYSHTKETTTETTNDSEQQIEEDNKNETNNDVLDYGSTTQNKNDEENQPLKQKNEEKQKKENGKKHQEDESIFSKAFVPFVWVLRFFFMRSLFEEVLNDCVEYVSKNGWNDVNKLGMLFILRPCQALYKTVVHWLAADVIFCLVFFLSLPSLETIPMNGLLRPTSIIVWIIWAFIAVTTICDVPFEFVLWCFVIPYLAFLIVWIRRRCFT